MSAKFPVAHHWSVNHLLVQERCKKHFEGTCFQRRHHREDWGGHVLPNIFQDRFFNSSKSEEKYLGGGGTMVAHEKNSSTDKQGNEKDFC